MRRIENSIDIEAPLEKVYGFAADWQNLQRYFDYIREVKPLTDKTIGPGARLKLRVRQLGRLWYIQWEGTEHTENVGWTWIQTVGKRQSVKRWRFAKVGDSTRLTFTAEYELGVIGYIPVVLFLEPQWRRLYKQAFRKLKSLIEADMAPPVTGNPKR